MPNGASYLLRCVLAAVLMFAAAEPLSVQAEQRSDPLKPFNKRMQRFNDFMDRHLLKPVARGYRFITPNFVDIAVTNFFSNLFEPRVVLNQLLQGKPVLAGRDTARFLMNSTFGVGGLIDVGRRVGLDPHDEDFGQTLGVWGAPSGPYIVLPLLGSSSARDASGLIVDYLTWRPIQYVSSNRPVRLSLSGLYYVDLRADLIPTEDLISGDRYVFLREAYLTRRKYLVHDGRVEDPFLDEEY